MLETFSTEGLCPAEAVPFWNDVAMSTIGPITIDPHDRGAFQARLTRMKLRNCEILSPSSMAASIESRPSAAEAGILNLQVQHSGRSWTRTGDTVCTLEPGDFMLYDPSRPFRLEFAEATQVIVVRLPLTYVEERLPGLRRLAGIPGRGDRGAGAMLSSFVRNAWTQLRGEDEFGWADSLCEAIWPLVDMAYAGLRAEPEQQTPREKRQREVFAFIDENLCEPTLSARVIADELGISARYVQIIFAEIGTTPSAYIQARRLDRAAALFARIGAAASITTVAFDVGFNDLSSFCRAFRRRFAVAPRDYRDGRRG
jgi:AraC-like DNA-binding protein